MKLYLSSHLVPTPRAFFSLIGKPPEDISLCIIPNAKDSKPYEIRQSKIEDRLSYFTEFSIKANVVDLREYHTPEQIKNQFLHYDALWVLGGNTFRLRYEMKRSGFDQIIRSLVEERLVYGGESAGSIVAGPSLTGVEHGDDPALALEIIWDGLGLIPQTIIPHVGSLAMEQEVTNMRASLIELGKEFIELTDTQALIIDGNLSHLTTAD